MPLLKGFDRLALSRVIDVIKSFHQAVAPKCVDLKVPDRAVWQGDRASRG